MYVLYFLVRLRTKVHGVSLFVCLFVRRLLVRANVFLSSPILVTLMMQALRSPKTSVLKKATRRNIPEGAILHFSLSIGQICSVK
jgi:hypothetical protein